MNSAEIQLSKEKPGVLNRLLAWLSEPSDCERAVRKFGLTETAQNLGYVAACKVNKNYGPINKGRKFVAVVISAAELDARRELARQHLPEAQAMPLEPGLYLPSMESIIALPVTVDAVDFEDTRAGVAFSSNPYKAVAVAAMRAQVHEEQFGRRLDY
ncbi:MAG TPA: hypothetical protein VL989_01035 [Candidatus Sulfotelmatobacter sp.]|nr:hypothetical protein [Candidatus Sulfotelmatobacter sp.]